MNRKLVRCFSGVVCLLFIAAIGLFAKFPPVNAEHTSVGNTISYMPKTDRTADVGTTENPFTILEIVPNKSMGMIGYMIPGCEPVDMDAAFADATLHSDFLIEFVNAGLYSSTDTTCYNLDVIISNCFEQASSYDGFVSQVITVTPDQLTDENLSIIYDADLINITAQDYGVKFWDKYNKNNETLTEQEKAIKTFGGANGNDLSWNATLAIVEKMASKNPAAMILQFNVMCGEANDATKVGKNGGNKYQYNMEKLYIMLMQYGAKSFWNTFVSDTENFKSQEVTVDGKTFVTGAYRNVNQGKTEYATTWDADTFQTDLGAAAMHESAFPQGKSEVFGSILTYNGDMSMLRDFVAPNKIEEVKPQVTEWYKAGTNSEVFDYYQETTGTRPTALSMNQATKYIISGALGNVGYKEKLRILEVQPCNEFVYGNYGWQLFYTSMFPWFTGDLEEDLTVTTMTTYQLIGDMEDLNSEYDLIFIGDKQDGSNGMYGYNDPILADTGWWDSYGQRGLIYTSVGDLVVKPKNSSDNTSNYWTYENIIWSDYGSDAAQLGARYAGNDLTKKKMEELREFLAGGKPIVVAAGLYEGNHQINTNRVDSSSYLYQLGNLIYKEGINDNLLFRMGYYINSTGYDRLKGAIAKETCEMKFLQGENTYPTVYTATTKDGYAYVKKNGQITETIPVSGVIESEQYNQLKDAAGNPQLSYQFTLEGNASSVYGIHLYIDRNGDGIYNGSIKENKELVAAGKATSETESEEISNISIIDIVDGQQIAVTDGTLYAGHTYMITRSVPAGERGILPWKLELYDKNNDSIRCSEINETAIAPATAEKVKIEVLQMNVMPDMREDGEAYVNFADSSTQTGAKFETYLAAVEDFNVHITYMENSDWYAEYGENGSYARQMGASKADLIQKWENALEEVDMLVIGYCDMASFTNDEVFYQGFMEFVNSGKSVILGHDLVKDASFYYRNLQSVSNYDDSLRTLSGQRRKYYVSTELSSAERNLYQYGSTTLRGQQINLVPAVDMQIKSGWWPWDIGSISQIYQTEVDTNRLTADGQAYQSDTASTFMDNSVRLYWTYASSNDLPDRVMNQSSSDDEMEWPVTTQWVRVANEGQITSYPYDLGEVIQVSATHAQNFQLDLEQDDGNDVTVWYNLTDEQDVLVNETGNNQGIYSSKPGDSRNNYYIYTKGNITYTGLGHSNATLTDDEVKLFVNTMISAYRAVPAKPYIRVENEDAVEKDGTYTMYLMLNGVEEETDTFPVKFTVVEESLTEGATRSYYLQYQDEDGNPLENQVAVETTGQSVLQFKENELRYVVSSGGNYTFQVPYQTILEQGEAVYYLDLCAEDSSGTDTTESHKITKIIVYAMPLFMLH